MSSIPLVDLNAHHAPRHAELMRAIEAVVETGAFLGGPAVTRFEEAFAAYCGARYAIAVGSGTDALFLALRAYGVGPGDEVITVPNSFFATAEAISFCGATPVFVDVLPDTATMNSALLEAAITPATRAIVPVHLFGQPADMDPIREIARRHKLAIVEDACQAHGARYKGTVTGTLGDAACFSFYPGKNLGAFGDAGAVVTNDAAACEQMRAMREHGQTRKHVHTFVGWNARIDAIQAAVLEIKLRDLDQANSARRACAKLYRQHLSGVNGIVLPTEAPYSHHNYHVYAVRLPERDRVLAELSARGIACGIHYPVPIHLQPAYSHLGLKVGSFPVAERLAGELLSLPIYPELTPTQIETISQALIEVHTRTSSKYASVA